MYRDEEEYPVITVSTDWDTGVVLTLSLDTGYEPLSNEVIRSQLIATLQAVGMSDRQVNEIVGFP